jgi:polar amino acid transport system substrate-binding protein
MTLRRRRCTIARRIDRVEQPMLRIRILVAAIAAIAGFAATASSHAQTLDKIKQRGVLVVGTKADYKPFGFRDPSGAIIGFEPDLAKDVADRLHVKVQIEPVVGSNRMQFLQQGKIDLMIATMNDTPERRKLVDFVQPSYYASGVNVLAPRSLQLRVWQQLRTKRVCTIEGSFYVQEIKERYAPELLLFKNTGDMYDALKQGKCVSAVYDDTALIGKLQSPDWREFEMPLRSILVEPWGMAVKPGEARLEAALSDVVTRWHQTARIAALEARWGIPKSAFADEMHERYAR